MQPGNRATRAGNPVRVHLRSNGTTMLRPHTRIWRPICGSDVSGLTAAQFDRLIDKTISPDRPPGSIAGTPPTGQSGLDIVFTFLTSVPPGAAEAFTAIEHDLESRFSDDAVVEVEVVFSGGLGANILGTTVTEYVEVPYADLRNALSADMDPDDTLQASLPAGNTIPVRYSASTETIVDEDRVFVTVANHEATIGSIDIPAARLTFNTDFNWAFDATVLSGASCANDPATTCCASLDCPALPGVCNNAPTSCTFNSDCPAGGVCGAVGFCEPAIFSFRDVLMHEMGHVMGFTSAADSRSLDIETLDVFRFQQSDGTENHNPDTLADFATTPRMVQNAPPSPFDNNDVVCDLITSEYRMSDGDPDQASHFAPSIAPPSLMEPNFCRGATFEPDYLQPPDLAILDAIGWDTPPANTSCQQADTLACGGTRWFDNSPISASPSPAPTCASGGVNDGTLWFSFIATATSARLSTCQSTAVNPTIAVFEGACGALTEIACSQDSSCAGPGTQAEVCLTDLGVGQTYYVQFSSGTAGDRGQYAIELHCGCDPTCAETCCVPLSAPLAATDQIDMGRYIAFAPGVVPDRAAVRLTLTSLQHPVPPNLGSYPPPDYSSLEGKVRWLGPVEDFVDTPALGTFFRASRTQCDPYIANWDNEAIVYVTGPEVVPSSVYQIEFVSESCIEAFGVSAGPFDQLSVTTSRWADVAPPYQDSISGALQPNVFDITAIVDQVKGSPSALGRPQTQLTPLSIDPNHVPSVIDITSVVDGVKGRAFPFEPLDVCAP